MKRALVVLAVFLFVLTFLSVPSHSAEPPIVIGAPLPTAFLYGWDAERGIKLAVEGFGTGRARE
jgi:branched-chain amino acid transport system substrate-binding protein